jgi:RND family efflux transporter MFP subunit
MSASDNLWELGIMIRASGLAAGGLLVLMQGMAWSADAPPAPADKPAAPAAPATVKAVEESLRIELKVEGVLEAVKPAEVVLRPKGGSALVVKKAAAHGQHVKKGQPVLWFETDKLDDQIVASQQEVKTLQGSLRDAEAELKMAETTSRLDLQAAQRSKDQAQEELDYYVKVRGPRARELAENSLKNSRFNLEYAEEELKQLEQMYKADDLTEQTEEIILKRTQRSVDQAKIALKSAEIARDRALNHDFPEDLRQLKEAAQRAALACNKAQVSIPTALEKKRADVEKLRRDQKQAAEKLADLKRDLARMTVAAPCDGTVYYGAGTRGRWQDAVKLAERLQPGATLLPNQPAMTIVPARPLQVRIDVAEKDLAQVRVGQPAVVALTAMPQTKLDAKVSRLSSIPVAPGVFDCQLSLKDQPADARIVAGMVCSVTAISYDKPKAVVVPVAVVFAEDGKDYVYVVQPEGKAEKRAVVIGKRTADKAEVLRGLKAGEEIYPQKPAESQP